MKQRGRRGFTLLEVMVAMAILATVLVVLLENHGFSLRLSAHSRSVTIAINLAKDLMTELELQAWPEMGASNGNFEQIYPGMFPNFRWEQDVEENAFWTYVRECTIRVFWMDGPVEQKVEITEYVSALNTDQQAVADQETGGSSDDDAAGAGGTGGAGGTVK